MLWLLLALGGAAGTLLRYAVSRAAQPLGSEAFPMGTLAVNVAGSFLIGLLATLLLERSTVSAELRITLTVGVLGGFTTFSAFSFETLKLLNDGEWPFAALNVTVSVLAGLAAVWAGQTLARV